MNVEISLNDDRGQQVMRLNNSNVAGYVTVSLYMDDFQDAVDVNIDELKTALRKITTK